MAKNNFLDKTGATWLITKFKTMLNNKVDKDGNKVLSTNDYTEADKTKLGGIAEKAQVNVLEDIKVNNTSLEKTGKSVNIDLSSYAKTSAIPTDNKGLTNGAGYQTASEVQTAIGAALSDITGIDFQIVNPLPETGKKGTIYLVSNSGSNPNAYDEYIWLGDTFEKIASTDIDLSGYAKTADFEAISTTELDNMWKTV